MEVEVAEDEVEEWVSMEEEEDGVEDSVIVPDLLIMDMEEEMGDTMTNTTKSQYIIHKRNTTIRHIINIIPYK
jgi:hypothetical protein